MNKLIVLMLMSPVILAHAEPGSACYQIQNQDKRNYCLATAKNDRSYCYPISGLDARNLCLALVAKQRHNCLQISERDQRNFCLGQF